MRYIDYNRILTIARDLNLSGEAYGILRALAEGTAVEVVAVPEIDQTYIPHVFIIRPLYAFGLDLYQIQPSHGEAPPPFPMTLEALARWAQRLRETKRPRPDDRPVA